MKFYTYGDKCNPLIVVLPWIATRFIALRNYLMMAIGREKTSATTGWLVTR